MADYGRRRYSNNQYQRNNNNRRSGRGRGRSGGRGGGRGRGKVQDYSWTAGGPQTTTWTAGGDDSNNYEVEDFPLETQSGLLFGLSDDVVVPGSVNQELLQGEILETLKRLPSDIVNLMLTQYDTCVREGGIRNKSAYMLGIINSGPRMGLPQGVVVPANVKFSLMQGVVLDDLIELSVPMINDILGEFDQEIRARGDTIYDRYSFLAGIIRKHKKNLPSPPKKLNQHQYIIGAPQTATAAPQTTSHTNGQNAVLPANMLSADAAPNTPKNGNGGDEDTLAMLAHSLEKVQMLTESLAKVTGELVAEKEKRSSLEAIAKSEQVLREATEERLQTALRELETERELREKEQAEYKLTLKYESDRRQAIEKEIKELKDKIEMERAEKHRAEDRLSVLEEVLISERDVRDQERHDQINLPEFTINSEDFDSDAEHE